MDNLKAFVYYNSTICNFLIVIETDEISGFKSLSKKVSSNSEEYGISDDYELLNSYDLSKGSVFLL